jgi:N-acetylmuramoyl-L-alanine amidase
MLDAGHYGKYNSGAVSGYYESDMTWKLHNYLKSELEKYGFEVGVTRTDKNKDLRVYDRGLKAKGYDLFISLHSNAINSKKTKRVVVIYPVSGAGKDISQKLGDAVLETMNLTKDDYWYTQLMTRSISTSDPDRDYYGVIRGAVAAGCVGIIIEHSFHTNEEACKWLMVDANLKKLAASEAKVLAEHYGLVKKETATTEGKYYIQVGTFLNKDYADNRYYTLKNLGFKALMTQNGSQIKVVIGPYASKKTAETASKKVVAAGFDVYITDKIGTTVTPSAKKTIDELAREVIQGKWGMGTDRKSRLTKAGYDYEAVQTRVNELMRKE